MTIIGKRIKKLRKENNLTQEEFGKIFGIAKSTVSLYESGKSNPDDQMKQKIANHFNVSIDYLLGNTDERKPVNELIKNEEAVEIEELLERYQVMLEGDELDESAKKSVIDFLRLLKNRDNEKKK
mgnify:CR=1 FL=1